jgi:mono/diheme cytochrome c family protein
MKLPRRLSISRHGEWQSLRLAAWLSLTSVLIPVYSAAAAAPPLAVLPIDAESLAQIRKRHPLASATVDDPVYQRKQRYEGFWLRDLLQDLTYSPHPESGVYVRFRCKDGYLPIMPLSRALSGGGLVAIRDLDAPAGQQWQPTSAHGTPSTPAPSYLVWAPPAGDIEQYPWPYQMVAIELVTSAGALGEAASAGAPKSGSGLFVEHCLKCHAINGVGGTFGPELNSPCSVTEYWNPGFLNRFIADAPSIRVATKMPDFRALSAKDIQAIVAYLQYMAGHKKAGAICPSAR